MADTGGEASRSGRRLTERLRSTGEVRTPLGPSAIASSARSAEKAEADTLATITVGGITYRLPFADLLPALAEEDLNALRNDIRGRSIIVPIVINEHHNVIDGANRLRIAALGIRNVRADIRPGLSFAEKEELAEDLNLHRRHLSREELRALIRRRLQRHPQRSNRQIAKAVGADDHTVAAIRRDLETTAEIPQLPKTVGRDGRARTTTLARRAVHCFTATDVTRAAEVAKVAAAEPKKCGHLLEAMSRTGRVAGAHRNWLRGQTEHCLLAIRGRPVVTLSNQSTLITGPLREHSRKPDAFYALVESLCPTPPGGRIELFARKARPGWAAMSAEIDCFPAAKEAAR